MEWKDIKGLANVRHVVLSLLMFGTLAANEAAMAGTWTALAHTAPGGVNLMLQLSDGTIMAANNNGSTIGSAWFRLTPDSSGSYINGTWTNLAGMHDTRLYYSAQVLMDGRVFVAGGEYGTGGPRAEVYNPLTNIWTQVNPPTSVLDPSQNSPVTGSPQQFYDSNSEILADGSVLIAPVMPKLSGTPVIYNPNTNTWSTGPHYVRGVYQDEASWVKLPDDSILTIDPFGTNSERYIPSTNTWVNDGVVPIALYDPFGSELGGALLLPNGKAFFLGSTGHTALYTPSGTTSPGNWVAGPDIPGSHGTPDAPAAMMVTGNVLCAVSPIPTSGNHFPSPTTFYEYDPVANAFTSVGAPTGSSDGISSYQAAMLVLPDGNILYSHMTSQLYVYHPSGAPLGAGKPVISTMTPNGDGSYHLTGTGFNGISEGATYGDDLQMNSNYPLVRLTSGGGTVYYARTYNWSRTSVMTGSAIVTTEFTPPAILPPGVYSLAVVANGNASDPIVFPPCSATPTKYVKADAVGANDGTSWTDAYTDLQSALASASGGGQIWVAAGTYRPAGAGGSRAATFQLASCVSVYGGFVGNETLLAQRATNPDGSMVNVSLLNGDLNNDDGPNFANNGDNSYHVVTGSGADASAVLDGVTISGGNADGSTGGFGNRGGGILIDLGSPVIKNCIIQGNSAVDGGGMHLNTGCASILTNCTISNNRATGGLGGGVQCADCSPQFNKCALSGNVSANRGGGIYLATSVTNPTLNNCVLTDNSGVDGAGIYNHLSSPIVRSCRFENNTALNTGGGGVNEGGAASYLNCAFGRNSSALGGAMNSGASTSATVYNCLFSGNTATQRGGGLWNNSPNLRAVGCTFMGNSASISGGGVEASGTTVMANCIVWGNTGGQITGSGSVTYSDIQGAFSGTGNINADPLFIDADGADNVFGTADDNLRIPYGSPCIDVGNNASVPATVTTDLDGNSRIADGNFNSSAVVDMGVFEFQPPLGPIPDPMSFASAPTPLGTTSITMTATTAIATSMPIQYRFECTSASPGGTTSPWQVGIGYTDTGLSANSPYSYHVAARDNAFPVKHQTAFSPVVEVSTPIETPQGLAPGSVGLDYIELVALGAFTNLSDGQSGLYFDCVTPGGNTGLNVWVQGTTVTATGLMTNSTYEFHVKARNRDGVETPYCDTISVTTIGVTGDCNNDAVFSVESDMDCIADALMGIEDVPGSIGRMDLNYDGVTDGLDAQAIADCLQFGGC